MSEPITIVGNHLSPYVRKVLAVCHIKGIRYRVDPIVPFHGDDRFTALNPVRRIPVLIQGDLVLPDSTVISEYLEELHPAPSIWPAGAVARAKARWLDEYADTRMAQVMIWKIFGRALVGPAIFGAPRDHDAVAKSVADELPPLFDELEAMAPAEGFAFGAFGLADLSVASHFANLRWARQGIDAARWPKTAGWVARVEASEPMAGILAVANQVLRLKPGEHRSVLEAAGIEVVAESIGGPVPRRGPLSAL